MGHERIGTLPKSKRWRDIVNDIAVSPTFETEVPEIARRTLENLRSRFRFISLDINTKAAFRFLVTISVAFRGDSPFDELNKAGIDIEGKPTPLKLAQGIQDYMSSQKGSHESRQIAQAAAVDAIALWYEKNKSKQRTLFDPSEDPKLTWKKAGSGSGFCELSRIFFSKYTERYLKYFLEREASAVLNSVEERDNFNKELESHIEEISKHAFETSKITQSFAAGWFNKNAKENIPGEKSLEGFLIYALGKMRDELLRESKNL